MLHVHITRYPADHGLLCSVSTYKLHLEVTLWLRCGCIMSVSAGSTTRGEKTVCLQFLLLLEFSSSFPARALPSMGSSNSTHSEIQQDSLAFTRSTLRPCGLKPTRLRRPWDFPGKSTGVGCHFLLQGIFLTQGSNPGPLHYRQTLLPSEQPGKS